MITGDELLRGIQFDRSGSNVAMAASKRRCCVLECQRHMNAASAARALPADHSETSVAITLGTDQFFKIFSQHISQRFENVTAGEYIPVRDNEQFDKTEDARRFVNVLAAEVFVNIVE